MNVVKPKPKLSLQPTTKHRGNPTNQSKLDVITCGDAKRGKRDENELRLVLVLHLIG